MTTERKPRRVFKEAFKKQMVELHKSGKPRKDIIKEYELTPSSFKITVIIVAEMKVTTKRKRAVL